MSRLILSESPASPSAPASGKTTNYSGSSNQGEPRFVNDSGSDIGLLPNRKYNFVRNAGFWFAQRQAPGTLTTYSSVGGRAISADGWGISNENASVQYQRTDAIGSAETGLQARYYGTFSKITATGKMVACQVIEASDVAVLRGATVRLQMKLKASAPSFRFALAQLTSAGTVDTVPNGAGLFITAFNANGTDPTLGANLSYIAPKSTVTPENGTISGNGVNVVLSSSSWTRVGACYDIPSTCKNLVVLVWFPDQATAGTTFSITEVSLTDGMAIQDWATQSLPGELARVQRYYCKSFNVDTLPAQTAGLTGALRGHVSVAGATANQPIGLRYPVAMRVAPTFTFYNPSNADAFVRNTTAATNATATAASTAGDQGSDIFFTGIAAWTVAQAVAVHFTADAEL